MCLSSVTCQKLNSFKKTFYNHDEEKIIMRNRNTIETGFIPKYEDVRNDDTETVPHMDR